MVVEAETTILFQIVLYLNLIYLIQQQIKWFHGFLLVDKQWGTSPWANKNTDIIVKYPIAFKSDCYISLATIVQSETDGKSASVQIGTFTNKLTEIHFLYTNTNLVSIIYSLRSYWISIGK